MSITIRPATDADAPGMAELLSEIIEIGGTTAYTDPITSDYLIGCMAEAPGASAWHIALNDTGVCVGFQWVTIADYLPEEACEIATFAKAGQTGLGIGSKFFAATKAAAISLGYKWINANIRSDNESGLAYYSAKGFKDYDRQIGIQLANGLVVDKILKRFDLS